MYIHVKSETNVRPKNDVDADATGHPQWNDETERDKAAARAMVEYEDRQRRRGEGRAKL